MIVILDLETQELIPPSRELKGLRISLAGVAVDGEMRIFRESELQELFTLLDQAELIVGHNLLSFDYPVLQNYAQEDILTKYKAKTFDILRLMLFKTDRLISLNDLTKRNLGKEKLGSGTEAPALFQAGNIEALEAYLTQDVLLTQELFQHICTTGKLKYGHIAYKDLQEREIKIEKEEITRSRS